MDEHTTKHILLIIVYKSMIFVGACFLIHSKNYTDLSPASFTEQWQWGL